MMSSLYHNHPQYFVKPHALLDGSVPGSIEQCEGGREDLSEYFAIVMEKGSIDLNEFLIAEKAEKGKLDLLSILPFASRLTDICEACGEADYVLLVR